MKTEAQREQDLGSMRLTELTDFLVKEGYPKFRASQVYHWLHVQQVSSAEEMTNLPKDLKAFLAPRIKSVRMVNRQISRIDGTQKFLFAMDDDCLIESVFMKYKFGNSVCVSSQVGCRMGCRFCASTLDGLERNLTPSEILGQIYAIHRITGEKISHVVVMGTGEPMDNYDNVVTFLHLLTDENGMNLSQRNVTVSTCGIVPRIYDLAKEKFQINLAISLHAVTDEKRRSIMPIANTYSIEEILKACETYFAATHRQLTFEYSLIAGVNDGAEDADRLARIAGRVNALVNLIPVNPVTERGYEAPNRTFVERFKKKKEKEGIHVSIRRVLGRDIDGACGQLRHREMNAGQKQGN